MGGVIGCCAGLSSVGSIIRLNHSNFRLWPVTVFTKTRANVITAAISSIAVQVSMGVGSGYSRRWGPEGKYMTQTELRSIADSLKIEIVSSTKRDRNIDHDKFVGGIWCEIFHGIQQCQ